MKIFAIGASRNIGYGAALRLLRGGHNVTFLLRNTSVFEGDNAMAPFLESKQASFVKGDALNIDDVRKGWNAAESDGAVVDFVMFSVGGTPSFKLTKGFVVTPANLCSSSLHNVLTILAEKTPQPRLIVVSSHGIISKSHATLPLLVKGVHALIDVPHQDKLALERLVYYSAGWEWADPEPKVLGQDWKAGLPPSGWLKSAVIIRPALLTSGVSKAEAGGSYRVDELLPGAYSVSREDISHFIAIECIPNWSKYENRGFSIGY